MRRLRHILQKNAKLVLWKSIYALKSRFLTVFFMHSLSLIFFIFALKIFKIDCISQKNRPKHWKTALLKKLIIFMSFLCHLGKYWAFWEDFSKIRSAIAHCMFHVWSVRKIEMSISASIQSQSIQSIHQNLQN